MASGEWASKGKGKEQNKGKGKGQQRWTSDSKAGTKGGKGQGKGGKPVNPGKFSNTQLNDAIISIKAMPPSEAQQHEDFQPCPREKPACQEYKKHYQEELENLKYKVAAGKNMGKVSKEDIRQVALVKTMLAGTKPIRQRVTEMEETVERHYKKNEKLRQAVCDAKLINCA